MSNENWFAANDDLTQFSYGRNERNYTGIYLNQDFNSRFLEDISIMTTNKPESIVENIDSDTEVLNTFGSLNPLKQKSIRKPGTLMYTDNSNETAHSLNLECDEPVIQPYYRNNTARKPLNVDNIFHNPNIRNKKILNTKNRNSFTQPYSHTSLQQFVPTQQSENGQFSTHMVVNASQSYSTAFRPPDQNQYSHNNSVSIQEYNQYFSRIPFSSTNRNESVLRYCEPTQYDTFNASSRDPRLVRKEKNNLRRFNNFDGLTPVRYKKETYLDEELRIINMKLKNMNSSYKFGVVNDLSSDDHFKARIEKSLVNNTQNDLEAETYIDCNKYKEYLNTERNQQKNLEEMSNVIDLSSDNEEIVNNIKITDSQKELEQYYKQKIKNKEMSEVIDLCDDNMDDVSNIETTNIYDALEKYSTQENEIEKLRENDEKKLKVTVEKIIDNLNDDICGLIYTEKTLPKKRNEMIKTHNLNDKTKNNIRTANENILTLENTNFDDTHLNTNNINRLIEINKNYKRLTGPSIEYSTTECIQKHIDFNFDKSADVRNNQNVNTGLFTTKFNSQKFMSVINEDKNEKINNFSEKHNPNKNETNVENILNEKRSIIDHCKKSEKKTRRKKSKKRNKSKESDKNYEMYKDKYSSNTDSDLESYSVQVSNEQVNKKKIWTNIFEQKLKTNKNELINKQDEIVQIGNKNDYNIAKIRVKKTSELIGNNESQKINSLATVNIVPYVGVQSNPNTFTECGTSATNVGRSTHYVYDELSIRVQNSNETTEFNFTDSSSYKNCRSSIDFEKLIHNSNGVFKQDDEFRSDAEEPLIECSQNVLNKNFQTDYATRDLVSKSNKELFNTVSFENVDDKKCILYNKHQNNNTSTVYKYESPKKASQSQTVGYLFGNSLPIGRVYSSTSSAEKEMPNITFSEQHFNENSKAYDANEFSYKAYYRGQIKSEHFDDSNDKLSLSNTSQSTDTYETKLNQAFEDATASPKDYSIDNLKLEDHKDEYGTGTNESVDITSVNYILDDSFEARVASEFNKEYLKSLNNKQNSSTSENQGTKIIGIDVDTADQLSSVQLLPDDVLLADKPPAYEPPADEPPEDELPADKSPTEVSVGEHFEMDYFYNIIKINYSLFRVNLHTEDDIFNFIQLYSQRTQTSWRVLKSYKSRKYDVCKLFGCLHNGLYKLLKKSDKKIKLNKCECQAEIDIKIKCSTPRGKISDSYLKNGIPAIVRFRNNHNHLVSKVTELPLLRSITDISVKKTFDNDFEPSKIFQAYNVRNHPNASPSAEVDDTTSSLETDVDEVETNNFSTGGDQNTENVLSGNWENADIQCDVVQSKDNEHLVPGQQIVNKGKRVGGDGATAYQLVDTSYNKEYFRQLKNMMSDSVKSKWMSEKMVTEAAQVCLYKCSGKKCHEVFSDRKPFVTHLSTHYRHSNNQKKTRQFMLCMYCFKSFDMESIDALANHIADNYTFCKYFCRYCLYRAYTASHVLIHEYIIHKKQKPSILKLKDRHGHRKEIVRAVDFNKFVLRYVCNIGRCNFYSYMNSDFLSHLSQDHIHCDEFCCDICAKCNDNGFISFNPNSFVKHFNFHSMNIYQCIFCLYGAEFINVMIIHLAMEHFEYEPLCLERCPINNYCDNKKIENLKILNIKKYVSTDIIKVVNAKPVKDLRKECQIIEIRQTNLEDTGTNLKTVNIDDITQSPQKSTKKVVHPSKNTTTTDIDYKNNMILSDEASRNVPQDTQQTSIVNNKKNASELSNYDDMSNVELKKNIEIPIKGRCLKTSSSSVTIDCPKKYANICHTFEICQTDSRNTCNNLKRVKNNRKKIQFSIKNPKKIVHSSKNTTAINYNSNMILSDETKRNIPQNTKQIPNVETSIINYKQNLSQPSNYVDDINNFELKKDIKIPINGKRLKTCSSDDTIDMTKDYACESLDSLYQTIKVRETDLEDTFTNTKTVDIDNTTQPSKRSTKNVYTNNIESKKDIEIPIEGKRLKTSSSDEIIDLTKDYENERLDDQHLALNKMISNKNSDNVFPVGNTYQDHLSTCPTESPIECIFCLAHTKSTFDIVEHPKLLRLNRFTCTFCNLELPSSDIIKSHVKEVHDISNVEFVPINIDETDIEKDRFLVCEDTFLKSQKRANDCSFFSESRKSTTIAHIKRSNVVNKHYDSQLTTFPNTTYTSKHQIRSSSEESEQQYKTIKRKHSTESIDIKSAEKNKIVVLATSNIKTPSCKPELNIPQFVPRSLRFKCPLSKCFYFGENMDMLKDHILSHRLSYFWFECPHCRPIVFKSFSIREMDLHLNFHGIDLYICQYCDYIHYKQTKIEAHQRRKHPSRIDSENKCSIIAIRKQLPIRKTVYPVIDQQTAEWVCNVCTSGIKYTKTEIAAHLSMVHKISNMFKCAMCQFDHSDYVTFEEHFKLNHPSLPVKYLTVHFNKVSPDVELRPNNKQMNVNEPITSTHHNMLNMPEALDGVTEPTLKIPTQEILIESTLPISTKSVGVLEDQEKNLDNPSSKPDDYLKLIKINSLKGKYECPICNVYITEEKESFREHMLKEINCTLWKCLECFTICDSEEKIKTHAIKHKQGKQTYEKIESFKKYNLVDEIIEYQNIHNEHEMLRKDNQPTDYDDQNGTKVVKVMSSLFNHIAHEVAVTMAKTASLL